MILDVTLKVLHISNLQLSRELKVTYIFKFNMQTATAFFIAQIPVFKPNYLPIIQNIQAQCHLCCNQKNTGTKNIIQPVVDWVLIFTA